MWAIGILATVAILAYAFFAPLKTVHNYYRSDAAADALGRLILAVIVIGGVWFALAIIWTARALMWG